MERVTTLQLPVLALDDVVLLPGMSVTFPLVNTTLAALPFAPGYELGCAATANC